MHQSTTPRNPLQPFPVVSHRLLLRVHARTDAARRGVPAAPVIAAVDDAWRRTHGDRFAARRAAWATVDALRAGEG